MMIYCRNRRRARVAQEHRIFIRDPVLQIAAYRFEGVTQPFPNHFHDFYVIGSIEAGERQLCCRNRQFVIRAGHVLMLNPGDSHGCTQCGDVPMDYWGLQIPPATMHTLTADIVGEALLPEFSQNVVNSEELGARIRALHRSICEGAPDLERQELMLMLMSAVLKCCCPARRQDSPADPDEVDSARRYMERHYSERIRIDDICASCGLSPSTLLRAFTRARGMTPYRYLMAYRIEQARRHLEQGMSPLDAAMRAGFCDQSHFTNCFSAFIGIPPGTYRDLFGDHGAQCIEEGESP